MDDLLEKSEGLYSEFSRIFEHGSANDSKRIASSWIMCLVAQDFFYLMLNSFARCNSFVVLSSALSAIDNSLQIISKVSVK